MLVPVLLFLAGFALLIKGGDWFVDGAVGIAHRFHLPELLIGATIVSIGTTLPEVMVSATSAVGGHGEIAYGNAIGSIICNTSLIAALTVAIRPGKVDPKSFRLPTAFFFAAALSYALIAWTLGKFERWMGIVYLCVFVGYMILSTVQMKKHPELADDGEEEVFHVTKLSFPNRRIFAPWIYVKERSYDQYTVSFGRQGYGKDKTGIRVGAAEFRCISIKMRHSRIYMRHRVLFYVIATNGLNIFYMVFPCIKVSNQRHL